MTFHDEGKRGDFVLVSSAGLKVRGGVPDVR